MVWGRLRERLQRWSGKDPEGGDRGLFCGSIPGLLTLLREIQISHEGLCPTDYGLDGPGSNSGADDRPWGPSSLLYNGYRVFPGGRGGRGVGWPSYPHLECRGPRKSRAIPLLTLRSFVTYKKRENKQIEKVFVEIAGFWAWDRFLDFLIRRVRSVEIVSCQDYMMLLWQMNDMKCAALEGYNGRGKRQELGQ